MILARFPFASKRLYDQVIRYFPFSTVDVVVLQDDSFVLTKRTISPYRGLWHLPGGIIRKGEKMENAARRAVKKELNLDIKLEKFIGIYENPIRTRHDITHCFIATIIRGKMNTDFQSKSARFFHRIPYNTIPYHKTMIRDALKLK